ncbi:TIGR03016 family PEP-CTERM system-associated outer membrane protein [Rhodoferax sp.]|uniref:TIGR03016 family PEP-CTERM system-associated outer membrane protein n=1 Tax=Rhodoferax sp. TaxID=50421 RepID=UPI00374D66C4
MNYVTKRIIKKFPKFLVLGMFFLFTVESKAQSDSSADASKGNGARSFQVTPRIYGSETWSDNISLQSVDKKSGWITEASPGIRISSGAGRVKGYLDYSLHKFIYSGGTGSDSLQNALNSAVSMEVVDNFVFLDVNGNISQQTTSAFGTQSNVNGLINSNKTEVSTYSISPYARGRLSSFADYEVRYSYASTNAKSDSSVNSTQSQGSFKVSGDEFFGKMRWALNGSRQETNRTAGQNIQVDSLNLTLTYAVNRQLNFYGVAGQETGNYTSTQKNSSNTSGGGVNWAVDETTKVALDVENRLLGRMHKLSFEHRTPRTSWRIADSKSISVTNGLTQTSGVNSNYDLLYTLFASIEPDPIKRAQMVRDFLQANGLSTGTSAVNGYLTSSTSIQRVQDVSFAILGIRDTLTFTATKTAGKVVSGTLTSSDDFAAANNIRQNGFTASYSHKLTKDTAVNAQFTLQNTRTEDTLQSSTTKYFNVNFSSKVGLKTYATISARHVISSGNSSPYRENALIGSLMVQF